MPRGRKNKPEINICRVQTWKLRELSSGQLLRAAERIGRLYALPKRDQGETRPRWLLAKFIMDLRLSRAEANKQMEPRAIEAYRRTYGSEPLSHEKVLEHHRDEAERTERLIWQMQQKRGCRISGDELVARDAIRQGGIDQQTIDRLRGKRRPKIR